MRDTSRPKIAVMSAADMEMALAWAKAEGWNPGVGDGPLYRDIDPAGFLVGRLGDEPVAIISVAAYDAGYAFVGFYIVRKDQRGRGYGYALWTAGLARAGSRTVGLDGVLAQVPNYRRSGFVTAHHTIRFAGPLVGSRRADPRIGSVGGDIDALVTFDAPHLAGHRDAFARSWISAPNHHVRVARIDGRIVGYGVARPAVDGFRVGPLYADAPDLAEALLGTLAADCGPQATLVLDVPEPNAVALTLVDRHGMRPVFVTARMYRGAAPRLPLDRIFALTSTEVG